MQPDCLRNDPLESAAGSGPRRAYFNYSELRALHRQIRAAFIGPSSCSEPSYSPADETTYVSISRPQTLSLALAPSPLFPRIGNKTRLRSPEIPCSRVTDNKSMKPFDEGKSIMHARWSAIFVTARRHSTDASIPRFQCSMPEESVWLFVGVASLFFEFYSSLREVSILRGKPFLPRKRTMRIFWRHLTKLGYCFMVVILFVFFIREFRVVVYFQNGVTLRVFKSKSKILCQGTCVCFIADVSGSCYESS